MPGESAAGPAAAEPWVALQTAFGAIGKRLPEMRDALSCYAAAQADRTRLAISQVGARIISNILQVVAVSVVVATAAWLVIVGVAGGLADVLDLDAWLANAVTGSVTLFAMATTLAIRKRILTRRRMQRLIHRYEARAKSRAGTSGKNGTTTEPSDNASRS